MQSKLLIRMYYLSGHLLFALLIGAICIPLYYTGLDGGYFIMYMTFVCLASFPLLNYYYSFIDRRSRVHADKIISPERIKLVLEAETTSRLLDAGFDQILAAFSVRSGKIIIYNPDSDSYVIYEQNGARKKTIRDVQFDRDSPLIRHFSSQNAVVYRKRLSPENDGEKKLYDEMLRLGGEMAVPIFYYERFIGVLLLGERRIRYSLDEIALLCSFASKIGILFLNSYLWRASLAKGDVKREYEMGFKVQHSFNSSPSGKVGELEYAVVLKPGMEPFFFYSFYPADRRSCVCIYRQNSTQQGALVFYPLLIPLTQTYSRFGYSPAETVAHAVRLIDDKKLLEGSFPMIHLSANGEVSWFRSGFSAPLLFDPASSDTCFVRDEGGEGETSCPKGSFLLIFDTPYMKKIGMHYEEILFVLKTNQDAPVRTIAAMISEKLADSGEVPDFFCVLRNAV